MVSAQDVPGAIYTHSSNTDVHDFTATLNNADNDYTTNSETLAQPLCLQVKRKEGRRILANIIMVGPPA